MKARNSKMDRLAAAGLVVMLSLVAGTAMAGGYDFSKHTWNSGRNLSFSTVEHDERGPYAGSCLVLATSKAQWNHQISSMSHDLSIAPAPAAPQVNWWRKSVLLVAMGERCAYESVQITAVQQVEDRLLVDVDVSLAMNRSNMYAPYHLVALDTNQQALAGLEVELRYNCTNCPGMDGYSSAQAAPAADMAPDKEPQDQKSWGAIKGMYR